MMDKVKEVKISRAEMKLMEINHDTMANSQLGFFFCPMKVFIILNLPEG